MALLSSEVVFEAWRAEQIFAGRRLPGLLMATNWRAIFIRPGGEFAAFPAPKVEIARTTGRAELILSVWYGRLVLAFDDCDAASAVETRLRQGQLRTGALTTPMGVSPDPRACADLLAGQGRGRRRDLADHPLLMLEPSL